MSEFNGHRDLTQDERRLVGWMLVHAGSDGVPFLPQLDEARATRWRCPCGCPSLNFAINGHPLPSGSMRPIADYLFGSDETLSGVFIYERNGILAGLEIYGLAAEPPERLPSPEALHGFEGA